MKTPFRGLSGAESYLRSRSENSFSASLYLERKPPRGLQTEFVFTRIRLVWEENGFTKMLCKRPGPLVRIPAVVARGLEKECNPILPFRLDRPPLEVSTPRFQDGSLAIVQETLGPPWDNGTIIHTRHVIYHCTRELPNQCDEGDWEDQWVEHQTWSLPIGPIVFQEKPLLPAYLASLLDGLSLKFTVPVPGGPVRETTCPVRAINPEILGTNKVLLSLENTDACAPFPVDVPQEKPGSLTFFNKAFTESEFQCGRRVTNWNGSRTYECIRQSGERVVRNTTVRADEEARLRGERLGIFEPYFPRIAVQGFSRSVGSTFGSLPGASR